MFINKYLPYRNSSESLGEREMLWEHEPLARNNKKPLFKVNFSKNSTKKH